MNKLFVMAAAALLCLPALAQETTLEGNGKLVTKTVDISAFSELKASGVFELHLQQGSTEAVKIEADENLQPLFKVKNEGKSLVIEMEKKKNLNLKSKSKMKVYVTFKSLESMHLNTVGNVVSTQSLKFDQLKLNCNSVGNITLKLNAKTLDISNNSVGNVTLSGEANSVKVKSQSVGNLEAGNLLVQQMDIENAGVGSAIVNVARELKVKDSFLGKVNNKGAASIKKMNNAAS